MICWMWLACAFLADFGGVFNKTCHGVVMTDGRIFVVEFGVDFPWFDVWPSVSFEGIPNASIGTNGVGEASLNSFGYVSP